MEEIVTSGAGRGEAVRKALSVLGVAAVLAAAVVGGNPFGIRETLFGTAAPEPRPAALGRESTVSGEAPETVLRSQPWWQTVERIEGQGNAAAAFAIDDIAIQWRVTATCSRGPLVVMAPDEPEPLIDAACPGPELGYGIVPGAVTLDVATEGSWELHVEQQIDVPLEEAPLPAMEDPTTTELTAAPLYDMERSVEGRVRLFRFEGGRYALRLEDFYVTPNVDLELRFSSLEEPRTTREFMGSRSEFVAPLDVTAGSLNFLVPPGVDPTKYKSLVIWCPPLKIAYAGATLEFGR